MGKSATFNIQHLTFNISTAPIHRRQLTCGQEEGGRQWLPSSPNALGASSLLYGRRAAQTVAARAVAAVPAQAACLAGAGRTAPHGTGAAADAVAKRRHRDHVGEPDLQRSHR